MQQKLHAETARISWHELQRFHARGVVLHVADELDLIKTAVMFAEDDVVALRPLLTQEQVKAPDNSLAQSWYDNNIELWSVVVAPFVLVQTINDHAS